MTKLQAEVNKMMIEITNEQQLLDFGADAETLKHYRAGVKQGLSFYIKMVDKNIVETSNVPILDDDTLIVWINQSDGSIVQYTHEYFFKTDLEGAEILPDGRVLGTNENGAATFFDGPFEYLAYWEDIELRKSGNRLHIFSREDAIDYITEDMRNSDNIQEALQSLNIIDGLLH